MMPPLARPGHRCGHLAGGGGDAGGIRRVVEPEHERAIGVGGRNAREVDAPLFVEGYRYRPQAGERRAHLVGGVRRGGIQHDVAGRVAKRQGSRERRHQLLRADARDHFVGGDRAAEPPRDPGRGSFAVRNASDGGRVAGGAGRRVDQRPHRHVGHRVDRRADRAVDDPPGHRARNVLQLGEAVVRIRRRDETLCGTHVFAPLAPLSTTNSSKRARSSCGRRARTRVPPSPCTSTNTSPSRWSAATTSPRS